MAKPTYQLSDRAKDLKQSGIRAVTAKCRDMGGINLGQGLCEIPTPDLIKEAAYAAIGADHNIYSNNEGIFSLREKIAKKIKSYNGVDIDPSSELMTSHGAVGAYNCVAITLFNPGDEVLLFEPFYGYHKQVLVYTFQEC